MTPNTNALRRPQHRRKLFFVFTLFPRVSSTRCVITRIIQRSIPRVSIRKPFFVGVAALVVCRVHLARIVWIKLVRVRLLEMWRLLRRCLRVIWIICGRVVGIAVCHGGQRQWWWLEKKEQEGKYLAAPFSDDASSWLCCTAGAQSSSRTPDTDDAASRLQAASESHGPGILPKSRFNSTSRTLLHLLHSNHNNLSYQENRREQPNSCLIATLDDFSNTSSLFGIESIFANLCLELIAPTLAASKDLDNVGPTVLTDDPG